MALDVEDVIAGLDPERRRKIELWCVFLAGSFSAYFSYYLVNLVFESIEFGDVSACGASVTPGLSTRWPPESSSSVWGPALDCWESSEATTRNTRQLSDWVHRRRPTIEKET